MMKDISVVRIVTQTELRIRVEVNRIWIRTLEQKADSETARENLYNREGQPAYTYSGLLCLFIYKDVECLL